ncbi:excisionase family DNA binding protein [Mycobacterium sp. BK086]|uniref:helix-turn-helix domain-containing protein n=1 Tax=Mycobacterium sp. BK086 TaxID=2512165 RepID=UPI00105B5D15|nr:helix-turn-helix domain-containing protein [Mycobacterium sp. BK086]TDO15016.1 excisionase family DNA binding protein [Mycobacterium sp. BK086]
MTTWLTKREAGDYARVSESTITQAVKKGELPAYTMRSGTQYRFRAEDIDKWLMSKPWQPKYYGPHLLD